MKYLLAMSITITLGAWTAPAQVNIPILNPAFDLDQLPCTAGYNCNYLSISGWLCGPQTYLQKTSAVQYPAAPAAGIYVAALGNASSTGSILQTLGAVVQANTTYILKVSVGARADYPFTGYEAALMGGNVVLAAGNSATPVGGTFVTDVIVYSSGAIPGQLGKPLQILVKSLGTGQVDVAAVTLTATTAESN
jgi:hypothetical protein